MLVTKQVAVPATTKTVVEYVKCELCSNTAATEDWRPELYQVLEPEVTLREGYNYPEDTSIETTILDICPDCFRKKLIPWFEAQGGTLRFREY